MSGDYAQIFGNPSKYKQYKHDWGTWSTNMKELEFGVYLQKIETIIQHDNADKLEIATLDGMLWQCVIPKDVYKVGDECIYIPIDSVLPAKLEQFIFGNSLLKRKEDGRVKTIKLRGVLSQGLVVSINIVSEYTAAVNKGIPKLTSKLNLMDTLDIIKYEQPRATKGFREGQPRKKIHINPNFHIYSDIPNYKNVPALLVEGETNIRITEKIHGTNFRAGVVKKVGYTLLDRIKNKLLKLIGKYEPYEFVFGSHNVQLKDKLLDPSAKHNVYAQTVIKYDLKEKLKQYPGAVLYGEIYGGGIQKGYNYGLKDNERKLVIFDILDTNKSEYLPSANLRGLCEIIIGEPLEPPVLYEGVYTKEILDKYVSGPSILAPEQKIREGIVIENIDHNKSRGQRHKIKYINDKYLLKGKSTDFH